MHLGNLLPLEAFQMSREYPDLAMMAPIRQIARLMETRDMSTLKGAFAAENAVLFDNFFPYLFHGKNAALHWAQGFNEHAKRHYQSEAHIRGGSGFRSAWRDNLLSMPTIWNGISNGKPFSETGGWVFVLVKHGRGWRVRCYAWAVTSLNLG
jgi:hypothetical protein